MSEQLNDSPDHEDEGVSPEEKRAKSRERLSFKARKAARRLLLMLVMQSPLSAYGQTHPNTSTLNTTHAHEQGIGRPSIEAIMQNSDRLVAAQDLAASLSFDELNGGTLDNLSLGLYARMQGVAFAPGAKHQLTVEDYNTLIEVELRMHGAMIDATHRFINYANQYYTDNPNAYDPQTGLMSMEALTVYRGYLEQLGTVVQKDGSRVNVFESAIAYIFEADNNPAQISQRLTEVMTKILQLQDNIEKMGLAKELIGYQLGPQHALLDRRAGKEEVVKSLLHINNKSQTVTLKNIIANPGNYNISWIPSNTAHHFGHYNIVDKSGKVVFEGRLNPLTGLLEYYDMLSSKTAPIAHMSTIPDLKGGDVSAPEVDGESWLDRLIASFHIDINFDIGVGIGVEFGGGRLPAGWNPSATRWDQIGWERQNQEWYIQRYGFVWDRVLYDSKANKALQQLAKWAYNEATRGVRHNQGGYNEPVKTAHSGAQGVSVKGNAPGGGGFARMDNP